MHLLRRCVDADPGQPRRAWLGRQPDHRHAQGYLHSETATSALRFTPVWRVETDTTVFYVNGITREVRQAE